MHLVNHSLLCGCEVKPGSSPACLRDSLSPSVTHTLHSAVLSPAGSQKSSRSHGSPPRLPFLLTPLKLMCCGENEQTGSKLELGEVRGPGWRWDGGRVLDQGKETVKMKKTKDQQERDHLQQTPDQKHHVQFLRLLTQSNREKYTLQQLLYTPRKYHWWFLYADQLP